MKELVDLAVSEIPEPESRIQKMFEWNFERDMTLARSLVGVAASIFVAIAVALFRNEIQLAWWWVLIVITSAMVVFAVGLYRFRQVRNVHKQFVSALKLHQELHQVAPFLKAYLRSRR